MIGFARTDALLRCDGVSLEQAAAEHGTPLYVYSRATLEAAYQAAPDLLRGQGQRQRRAAAPVRGRRRGGGHRLGR